MKRLLMATLVLLSFSIALLIIQTSCSKINAQSSNNAINQLNKIIYLKNWGRSGQIWKSDYDDSNAIQIPVILSPNFIFDGNVTFSISTSPDGQKIFFPATDTTYSGIPLQSTIYSCDISGGNVTPVVTGYVQVFHPF